MFCLRRLLQTSEWPTPDLLMQDAQSAPPETERCPRKSFRNMEVAIACKRLNFCCGSRDVPMDLCGWKRTIARRNATGTYPVDRTNIEVIPFIVLYVQPGGRIECLLLKRACDVQPKASSAVWISVTGATHDICLCCQKLKSKRITPSTQSTL